MHEKPLWDHSKIGTLILSSYRNGSHFLIDLISKNLQGQVYGWGEICQDGTIEKLKLITKQKTLKEKYHLAIVNNPFAKFMLLNNRLLEKWHVIKLTREAKIPHFISHIFWSTPVKEYASFNHHATDNETYFKHLDQVQNIIQQSESIRHVAEWLSSQLILDYIVTDIEIDYSQLSLMQTKETPWIPNDYTGITLAGFYPQSYQTVEKMLLAFQYRNKNAKRL